MQMTGQETQPGGPLGLHRLTDPEGLLAVFFSWDLGGSYFTDTASVVSSLSVSIAVTRNVLKS